MSTFLDFQTIKESNTIESVAERLGLDLKKSGNQLRGKCPSGEGGDRVFVITPAKAAWYSFAAEKGGDVIALVAFVNGCSMKEAAQFLQGDTVPEKKAAKSSSKEGAERGFRALEYLEPAHEAVEALGLEIEDAERLGIGYCPRGVLKGNVAIPIRTADGTLAGYIGIQEATLPPKWSA